MLNEKANETSNTGVKPCISTESFREVLCPWASYSCSAHPATQPPWRQTPSGPSHRPHYGTAGTELTSPAEQQQIQEQNSCFQK